MPMDVVGEHMEIAVETEEVIVKAEQPQDDGDARTDAHTDASDDSPAHGEAPQSPQSTTSAAISLSGATDNAPVASGLDAVEAESQQDAASLPEDACEQEDVASLPSVADAQTTVEVIPEQAKGVADIASDAAQATKREGAARRKLKVMRAPVGGTCDGCNQRVSKGKVVMHCRETNYYLCSWCHPIQSCPAGHVLQTTWAVPGRCDGCKRKVSLDEVVSDCRSCNWYLCSGCQPSLLFVAPESVPVASPSVGTCTLCKRPTWKEDVAINHHGHSWQFCVACTALSTIQGATENCTLCNKEASESDTVTTLKAPAQLEPSVTNTSGEAPPSPKATKISDPCSRLCAKGHELKVCQAVAGSCDGCGRRVATKQCVLNCEACNWYLCGRCHLSAASSGA